MNDFGLQLYTVRRVISDDTIETVMHEIKKAGYTYVQAAGSLENIEKQGKVARSVGLDVIGSVSSLDIICEDLDKAIDVHKSLGASDIGVSAFFSSAAEVEKFIRKANSVADILSDHGLSFSYHNHSGEFVRLENGKTAYDMLIEGLVSPNAYFMPDTYWIQHGGADVRYYIEKLKTRIKILHLKDAKMTSGGLNFAEIGRGNLFWEGIVESAKASGVKYFVVEQDKCDNSPLDSIKYSAEYLLTL